MEEIAGLPYADAYDESPLRLLVADDDALGEAPPDAPGKLDLSCTRCGYGVLRSTPPERCPMCQVENAWSRHPPRVGWSRGLAVVDAVREERDPDDDAEDQGD